MKIIFLDIDGVLSPIQKKQSVKPASHFPYDVQFSQEAVANLKALLEQSQAKIVFSTRWISSVGFKATVMALATHGITGPYVIGQDLSSSEDDKVNPRDWLDEDKSGKFWGVTITPKKFSSDKCHEISFWLSDNFDKISGYVVIDDDGIYGQEKYQVQTNSEVGLTKDDVAKCLTVLNQGMSHYKKKKSEIESR